MKALILILIFSKPALALEMSFMSLDQIINKKKETVSFMSKKLSFKEYHEYHEKNRTFVTSSERLALKENFKELDISSIFHNKKENKIAIIEIGFDCKNKEIKRFIKNNCNIHFSRNKKINHKSKKYLGHSFYVMSLISIINEDVELYPITVDDQPDSTALAIHHAIDQGIKIINISMNGYKTSVREKEAFIRASKNNVKIIISAGNENIETKIKHDINPFPSSYTKYFDNIISVGSSNKMQNEKFSNVGDLVDVYTIGRFKTLNQEIKGTSFSAPIITALISLGFEYKNSLKKMKESVYTEDEERIITYSKKMLPLKKINTFNKSRSISEKE